MPRLTKIYTRRGDSGTTSLGGGQRVPKASPRVQAYGTVDELNSQLGVALALGLSEMSETILRSVQNELFDLGSDLSFPEEDKEKFPIPSLEVRHVERLERVIDEVSAVVGPLENFILPGGSIGSAQLQVARTVCRRAERDVSALAREEAIGEHGLSYLNRLSDMLFVLARYENHVQGVPEPLWQPGASSSVDASS